jgi:hypothetical protein
LLAKHWIFAANSSSKGGKDNMSRVSCDESSEPLKGRKCSPILAKVVEKVRADDCFAIVSACELNDQIF